MWFMLEKIQDSFNVSEQLLSEINKINADTGHGDINAIRELLKHPNVQVCRFAQQITGRFANCALGGFMDIWVVVNRMHGNMMPLHCACIVGSREVVSLLLDSGAQPAIIDGYERTPLHYAAEKCDSCVELLLEAGAHPDTLDSNHNTPLHWACYRNRPLSAKCLLDAGANVDALDRGRDSPLSWAALRANVDVIALLLKYNANADTVNAGGNSPIGRLAQTIAIGIGSAQEETCLRLLIRACATIRVRLPWPGELACMVSPVRRLQHLSRTSVRRALGPGYLAPKVEQLEIPCSLRSYILLLA